MGKQKAKVKAISETRAILKQFGHSNDDIEMKIAQLKTYVEQVCVGARITNNK